MPDRLPALRFDTATLAPALRFDACRARVAAWKELRPADGAARPPADFRLATATWRFGPLALSRTTGPDGAVNHRGAAQARRDTLDHWTVSLLLRGTMQGEIGGADFTATPGRPFAYGLHLPHLWERGAAEWVTLFVPRDTAPELAAALDAARGHPVGEGLGALLAAHLAALPAALDALPGDEGPRAAEATLAMLRAALLGGASACGAAAQLEEALRARLLSLIRRHLDSVRLDPERLARLAGLSRTRLYEVFEPEGGVARAIQRERLRAVCRALADPADRRPIARVAEDLGMPDPSVFSRAFRREFGLTPREFRARAMAGAAPAERPVAGGGAAPSDLADLLRRLGRG